MDPMGTDTYIKCLVFFSRWAPTRYKWGYFNPISGLSPTYLGVTGRGPPCQLVLFLGSGGQMISKYENWNNRNDNDNNNNNNNNNNKKKTAAAQKRCGYLDM